MYDYIHGRLAFKKEETVTVDVNNIGYRIHCRKTDIENMVIGEDYTFHISFHMNESGIRLYGFLEQEGLDVFEHLISVSGIGPKNAIAILSGCSVNDLVFAIEQQDIDFLTKIPGIGKKTAGRIVLELEQKLTSYGLPETVSETPKTAPQNHVVIDALQNLGYQRKEIEQAMAQMDTRSMEIEEIIKRCLQELAKDV